MSLTMPLKRRVFHQTFFFGAALRCDRRVGSRLKASLLEAALRFDVGSTRDFHDLFERFGDAALRIASPWFSVGTVSVSAGGVILKMSSLDEKAVKKEQCGAK
jgi:hypothetical protein